MRLWLNDGSCVRLMPERLDHVRSYGFVQDRMQDGRIVRTLIDEFTTEALMIRVKRKLNSTNVVDALTDLFILRAPPEFRRSDNSAEFTAKKVRAWIGAVGARTTLSGQDRHGRTAIPRASFPVSGRASERRRLLPLRQARSLIERWPPLQHRKAAQLPRIPLARARERPANRPTMHQQSNPTSRGAHATLVDITADPSQAPWALRTARQRPRHRRSLSKGWYCPSAGCRHALPQPLSQPTASDNQLAPDAATDHPITSRDAPHRHRHRRPKTWAHHRPRAIDSPR